MAAKWASGLAARWLALTKSGCRRNSAQNPGPSAHPRSHRGDRLPDTAPSPDSRSVSILLTDSFRPADSFRPLGGLFPSSWRTAFVPRTVAVEQRGKTSQGRQASPQTPGTVRDPDESVRVTKSVRANAGICPPCPWSRRKFPRDAGERQTVPVTRRARVMWLGLVGEGTAICRKTAAGPSRRGRRSPRRGRRRPGPDERPTPRRTRPGHRSQPPRPRPRTP
jgi:hypothetical protein